ncbi:hypothetical protein B0H17DRAFT_1197895 [Mycena rosella]|uniref:F-box domain-containing protein n=1 Tax=Mycena rosella TaxID=1033263 RepID=A0AAD7DPU2_MYCRO|nr:hypothetical protein B0H17DRAFT_1197895 [Mycena rosella]
MEPSLSLAQTVPAELLSQIFKLSLPSQSEVLGRVCATWRTIALDMPSFWTSLVLAIPWAPNLSSPYTSSLSRSFSSYLVREHLARSGNQLLSIVFTSQEEAPARTTRILFRLISSVSARWEALELDVCVPLAVGQLREKFPLLRRLYLWGYRQSRHDWQQLIEHKTVYEDRFVLSCLEAFSLTVQPCDDDIIANSECLDSLLLPALTDLYIEDYTPNFSSLFVSLLGRSGCSLKRLWVCTVLTADAFATMAELNPHLEELGLIAIAPDCIMQKLSITLGLHPFLPELSALHIIALNVYFILLLDMLESRRRYDSSLTTVSIPAPYDRALKGRLDALEAGGWTSKR